MLGLFTRRTSRTSGADSVVRRSNTCANTRQFKEIFAAALVTFDADDTSSNVYGLDLFFKVEDQCTVKLRDNWSGLEP